MGRLKQKTMGITAGTIDSAVKFRCDPLSNRLPLIGLKQPSYPCAILRTYQ